MCFQGKLEYWLLYIQFTSTRNMKAQTSKAFIQAMQVLFLHVLAISGHYFQTEPAFRDLKNPQSVSVLVLA